MEKIETHVYDLTPQEVRKLPQGTTVFCYDTLFEKYSTIKTHPKMLLEAMPYCHYFIFDLPEGVQL